MTQIHRVPYIDTSCLPSICQRSRCLKDALGKTNYCIGHQPKPQAAIAVIGVFVELPTQTRVGDVAEFDHADGWG